VLQSLERPQASPRSPQPVKSCFQPRVALGPALLVSRRVLATRRPLLGGPQNTRSPPDLMPMDMLSWTSFPNDPGSTILSRASGANRNGGPPATLCSNWDRPSRTIHFRNLGVVPQIGPGLGQHSERGSPPKVALSDTGLAAGGRRQAAAPIGIVEQDAC